ncbi:DUF3298 and DUF4163 domain-containing protein [Treponema sp. Marseille-Q4132]|uniref:DUF3298 and DUF4163 domain-containing protein n=1 Tax=Treponema sp. Marseille-Q4132 TaxID=2766701 RepID=UPI001652F59F|nr:DUF3298 and DUF4163 domain-containing protein [Treponema sp. Marseille-Q4132]QNL96830.1 DUF3298 and DUF4163 domain-containing protein [Treponema sp. Marseille-Q4132]
MKTKHIVYSAVLASLVFAGCQTASQKGAAPYKMTTVSEKTDVFEAKIVYPQFAGFDDLNSLIKSRTLGAYNDFKSSAQKTRRELENTSAKKLPPFEYAAACDSIIVSDKYISMLFTAYRYEGGAHGETQLDSITYDKALKKEVSITEASGLSIKDIATQCKDYFMKRLSYGGNSAEAKKARTDWIAEGTIPEAGNYQTFTYDGKTLTVYFEPYTVAPYSEGVQKVTISAVR